MHKPEQSPSDLVTGVEAARVLGVHPSTISRLVAAQRLMPVQKLPGRRGAFLFRRDDLDDYATTRPAVAS